MDKTSYCIACKGSMSGGNASWLGGIANGGGGYWCDLEPGFPQPGTMEFWSVRPILGTDAYYLLNESVNLYASFQTDPGLAGVIALLPLDIWDPNFIIKLDNVGDGWVAINNSNKDSVFQPQVAPPYPGVPIVGYPWDGSAYQMWKFVDSNSVQLAASGKGL